MGTGPHDSPFQSYASLFMNIKRLFSSNLPHCSLPPTPIKNSSLPTDDFPVDAGIDRVDEARIPTRENPTEVSSQGSHAGPWVREFSAHWSESYYAVLFLTHKGDHYGVPPTWLHFISLLR